LVLEEVVLEVIEIHIQQNHLVVEEVQNKFNIFTSQQLDTVTVQVVEVLQDQVLHGVWCW
jgi:archaellum component FlaC